MEGIETPQEMIDEQSPDEDERQAMQNLAAPEDIVIDEQSPDEDERQAMQSLWVPVRRNSKRIFPSSGAS